MKGCLKHCSSSSASPLPSPGLPPAPPCTPTTSAGLCAQRRKCVAWSAVSLEEIHIADEWDRTPTEPSRNLSYRDMLELKEIQRSLPLANQPFDPFTRRPAAQYLTTVPINLLPLLPEPSPPSTPSPSYTTPINCAPNFCVSSPTSSLPHSPTLLPSLLPAEASCASFPSPSPLTSPPPSSALNTQLPSEQHFAVRPGRLFPNGIPSRSTSPSPANSRSNSRSSSPNRNACRAPFAKPSMPIIPLADVSTPTSSSPSSPLSPTTLEMTASVNRSPIALAPKATLPTHLSHLTHLLPSKTQARTTQRRGFAFLPLLDTPPSSTATTPMNSTFTTPSHSVATSKAGSVASSTMSSPIHSPSTVIKALESCVLRHDDLPEEDITDLSEGSSDVGGSTRSYDPPTPSLTNASLDSSPPVSRASSMSPEFVLRQLHNEVPMAADKDQGYFPHPSAYTHPNDAYSQLGEFKQASPALPAALQAMRLSALPSPALIPPSPLNLSLPSKLGSSVSEEARPSSPTLLESVQPIAREAKKTKKEKKKKHFIVINDEEIEVGGDSEEDEDEYEYAEVEIESQTSSSSGSLGGASLGGFVGVGMRNSKFSRSMGERMMWSSSYVMAFEDEDSLSRSPTAQDGTFVGVSSMLGIQSTTATSIDGSPSTISSMALPASITSSSSPVPLSVPPSLPSPELTPTPTPPPSRRAALLTPTSSPPPELRALPPSPSGLALALAHDEYEGNEGLRSRSRTPTLHEVNAAAASSAYNNVPHGQQATPPPSEPGSPRIGSVSLPIGSSLPTSSTSPVTIPRNNHEACCSSSPSSPIWSRGCPSPVGSRSSGAKVSMSPRISCSPKMSTSPKCVGGGNAVARKRASMSPRSSPVLA